MLAAGAVNLLWPGYCPADKNVQLTTHKSRPHNGAQPGAIGQKLDETETLGWDERRGFCSNCHSGSRSCQPEEIVVGQAWRKHVTLDIIGASW